MHYQLPFMYPLTDPPIPHYLQVLITLKYIATGSFQLTVSDCHEVSQSSVSRCITHVCRAVAMLLPHLIKMPAPNDSLKVMEDFKNRGNLPGVIGCINYTHVIIYPNLQEIVLRHTETGKVNYQCVDPIYNFSILLQDGLAVHTTAIYLTIAVCVHQTRVWSVWGTCSPR